MIGDRLEIIESGWKIYDIRITIEGYYHEYNHLMEEQKDSLLSYYFDFVKQIKQGYCPYWNWFKE